jgi:hypothetical protein
MMSMFDYDSEFVPIKSKADNLDPFWVIFWLFIIGICTLIGLQYFEWI